MIWQWSGKEIKPHRFNHRGESWNRATRYEHSQMCFYMFLSLFLMAILLYHSFIYLYPFIPWKSPEFWDPLGSPRPNHGPITVPPAMASPTGPEVLVLKRPGSSRVERPHRWNPAHGRLTKVMGLVWLGHRWYPWMIWVSTLWWLSLPLWKKTYSN